MSWYESSDLSVKVVVEIYNTFLFKETKKSTKKSINNSRGHLITLPGLKVG